MTKLWNQPGGLCMVENNHIQEKSPDLTQGKRTDCTQGWPKGHTCDAVSKAHPKGETRMAAPYAMGVRP